MKVVKNNNTPRSEAVIYLRSAGLNGTELSLQRERCEQAARPLNATVFTMWADVGASGLVEDRDGLSRLFDRLERQLDVRYVIVDRVERLAANPALGIALVRFIEALGATLIIANGQPSAERKAA
jgi:DNA invertase Pin-like site-specific DNA recombinase